MPGPSARGATGNSTPVLGFDGKTIELQQYVWDGSFTLSSSSVLSFDFWSWQSANIKTFSLQASFDGGTWTDLYVNDSLYNYNSGVSPAWTTQTIDLSSHAGSTARFRAIIPSADPSHYWFCIEGEEGVQIALDNFQVTGVGSSSEAYSATVANTARSHTITGLTAGKTYSFTVAPLAYSIPPMSTFAVAAPSANVAPVRLSVPAFTAIVPVVHHGTSSVPAPGLESVVLDAKPTALDDVNVFPESTFTTLLDDT